MKKINFVQIPKNTFFLNKVVNYMNDHIKNHNISIDNIISINERSDEYIIFYKEEILNEKTD